MNASTFNNNLLLLEEYENSVNFSQKLQNLLISIHIKRGMVTESTANEISDMVDDVVRGGERQKTEISKSMAEYFRDLFKNIISLEDFKNLLNSGKFVGKFNHWKSFTEFDADIIKQFGFSATQL